MSQHEAARILVVEDELIVAVDLESSLRELGFHVIAAVGDADEALSITAEQRPDLVLMDIRLHGEHVGIRAAETIRRNYGIPVVFLTAYTTEELMERARAVGAYGFLGKPFRVKDLKATILIALQQHKLSEELFAKHNWLITMLASLSDGVIAADTSGCVRYINPAATALTGWTSAEALGRQIEEVYPLSHLDGSPVKRCQLRRALILAKPVPKERFLVDVRNDGQIPVEDSAAPIIEEGHLLGAVTIFLDITARLEAEEQQRIERGRLRQQVQITEATLGQTKEELRALSGRLITAQEDERRRVARELHDDLGQRAVLMGWRAAELGRMLGAAPANIQPKVDALQEDLSQLATDIHSASHKLHPTVIADLGLAVALGELVAQQRRIGADITFVSREVPPDIPTDVVTTMYRIAQESLRNALQHAPGVPILLSLSLIEGELQLQVKDPGPGFDLEKVRRLGGLGLLSIQERARLVRGRLEIQTAPRQGTTITIRVPMSKKKRTAKKLAKA